MPGRGKRALEDFDPNKSDSGDSDYNASASRHARSKQPRSQRSKAPRKRQKTGTYDGSEDISDQSDATQESYEENVSQDEIEPEIDKMTGRPIRQAKKNRIQYKESDDEEDASGEADSEAEEIQPKSKKKQAEKTLSKKIVLRLPQKPNSTQSRRSTRARSASQSTKRPATADLPSGGTRRSSRIAHDDSVPNMQLTDSGHHAVIIPRGTRSPEAYSQRPTRGSKGVKHPPQSSVIHEEEEGSSARTKDEPKDESNQRSTLSTDQEIAASREDLNDEPEELDAQDEIEAEVHTRGDTELKGDTAVNESGGEDEDEDEDEGPVKKPRRLGRRGQAKVDEEVSPVPPNLQDVRQSRRALRSAAGTRQTRSSQGGKKRGLDESSDFEPGPEEVAEDNVSDSEGSEGSPLKGSQQRDGSSSSNARKSARLGKQRATNRRGQVSDDHDSGQELAEELQELRSTRRTQRKEEILFDPRPRTRRARAGDPDYRVVRPELNAQLEDDAPASAHTPSRRRAGASTWQRSMFSTYGPFGGAGGPPPLLGGPGGIGAAGGVDSDSSDDDNMQRPRAQGVGGTAGMTPTSAAPAGFSLFPPAQVHGSDPLQGPAGTPANFGRIKDKQALADADPLGVDQNVNFDSVGGLQDHIDKLKEMVALPLLYPEVFQRFHVTPPRGVLFHGPPGTGKTLLARALASSVSSQGKKVTFYMRKGADALSKWVGEAERQLRLLFEEARKTQPSIIFFDEIDGLAPVRSSKQEQIHASIVSTLLALMDGMDGRGQVIVIGATNRPDSIDPALRRPGRFDREFYFPLPNTEGRRAILNIHTKGWEPPLSEKLKDELAELTKGYGGADLRALCTEAALNAVQRRYPQIYKSNEKLQIKPETIKITAKDFMISIKKTVPSSERAVSSGAAPLPKSIEPLLRFPLKDIQNAVAHVLPQKKRLTALEEAEFEDAEGDRGMRTERMQQEFERSRIFRPRLLIRGAPGLGQQYLAAALLNHFEGLHVQSFDLPTLISDSTRSPEAAVVQLFTEVKRHKPSVIYIPNVNIWWWTLSETVKSTFLGLLRSISPTDPVLVLGVLENYDTANNEEMIKDLFGFSKRNQFELTKPQRAWRRDFFEPVIGYLHTSPEEFPEPSNRKKRIFETLMPVPPEPLKEPEPPSKEELRAQKKKDRLILNMLKLRLQPIMDQIRNRYRKFHKGVIDENHVRYLYDELDPNIVTTDLPLEQRQERPYEIGQDENGEPGFVEQVSKRFIYNMDTITIEKRLSNGYYKRPKDFLSDIKKMTRDAKVIDDQERIMKANEIQANVEVDIGQLFEVSDPVFTAECEAVWQRETQREKEKVNKARQLAIAEGRELQPIPSNVPPTDITASGDQSSGPITLGQPLINGVRHHPITPQRNSDPSNLTNGYPASGISDLSNLDGRHSRRSNGTSRPSGVSNPSTLEDQRKSSQEGPFTDRATQSSSFGPSAQTRPPHSYTGGPSTITQRQSHPQSLSQKSAVTPLADGSNPAMYTNEASTTNSSKRPSGSSNPINTQSTPSQPHNPDFTGVADPTIPNSQLPETQVSPPGSQGRTKSQEDYVKQLEYLPSQAANSVDNASQPRPSQSQNHHNQTPAVPPFPRSSVNSLLNNPYPKPVPTTQLVPSHPQLITDLVITQDFHTFLVEQTSSCSVEQLEQVYSALMAEIWRTRGVWNRVTVTNGVREVLMECLIDMKACQDFLPASFEGQV